MGLTVADVVMEALRDTDTETETVGDRDGNWPVIDAVPVKVDEPVPLLVGLEVALEVPVSVGVCVVVPLPVVVEAGVMLPVEVLVDAPELVLVGVFDGVPVPVRVLLSVMLLETLMDTVGVCVIPEREGVALIDRETVAVGVTLGVADTCETRALKGAPRVLHPYNVLLLA
jgi:hypothetical protein